MRSFRIVFLWRGERHQSLATFSNRAEADAALATFHGDGWTAWVEEVL